MDVIASAPSTSSASSVAGGGCRPIPGLLPAVGVFHGIKAEPRALHRFGRSHRAHRASCKALGARRRTRRTARFRAGATVLVADVHAERASDRRWRQSDGSPVDAADAIGAECDVYAPCALGATLSLESVPQLRCPNRRRLGEQPARRSRRRPSCCATLGNPVRAGLRHQCRRRDRDQLPRAEGAKPGRPSMRRSRRSATRSERSTRGPTPKGFTTASAADALASLAAVVYRREAANVSCS